jgi:hypothetical protein
VPLVNRVRHNHIIEGVRKMVRPQFHIKVTIAPALFVLFRLFGEIINILGKFFGNLKPFRKNNFPLHDLIMAGIKAFGCISGYNQILFVLCIFPLLMFLAVIQNNFPFEPVSKGMGIPRFR